MKKLILLIALAAFHVLAQDDEPVTNGTQIVSRVHVIRALDRVVLRLDDREILARAVQVDTNANVRIPWTVPNSSNTNLTTQVEEKEIRKNLQWFLNAIDATNTTPNEAVRKLRRAIARAAAK